MHYSLSVHMREGASDLMDIFNDLSLLKINFVFNSLLNDKFKVSFLCPFDSDKKFIKFAVNEPT